jgi:uncharacterized protein (TIGR02452 family)
MSSNTSKTPSWTVFTRKRKVMSRNHNASIASETVQILEQGWYESPSGHRIELRTSLEHAVAGTKLYAPQELDRLEPLNENRFETVFEFTPETTLEAASRLSHERADAVMCLNFASAKNPGGGFLGGAQAQEESLARSSGLYPTLTSKPAFYAFHRAQHDLLYSDHMIYSPDVPVFRDDAGGFLETPYLAAFITSPAPNAGAIQTNQPESLEQIPSVLEHRAAKILTLATRHEHTRLVLGAWGCGVFKNDPVTVARAFAMNLAHGGPFSGMFECVVFAIYDSKPGAPTLEAFRRGFISI